jgi:simple sugar transport system permease protein
MTGGKMSSPKDRFIAFYRKVFIFRAWMPIFIILVCALAVFWLLTGGRIFDRLVIESWLKTMPTFGILSVGVTMLMIAGEFDLSIGSLQAFAAMVIVGAYEIFKLHIVLAFLLGLATTLLIELLQSVVITKLKVSSFIVTLGGMMLWRSIVSVLIGGRPLTFTVKDTSPAFHYLIVGERIPMHFIWYLVTVFIFWVMLGYTSFGNRVFATGGNAEAARRRGVNVDRIKITCYLMLGALVAFSAAIQADRTMGAHTNLGLGLELRAIAAAVVGGTSLFGGQGTILGTVFAVLFFSVLDSGLLLLRAPGVALDAFIGAILIIMIIARRFIEKTR